jgi:N-succinyldiaminopimelate aminotransferase
VQLAGSASVDRGQGSVVPGVSPFVRLRDLLAGISPPCEPIDLALGEPQMPVPATVAAAITAAGEDFGHYPAIRGSTALRSAIAAWLGRYRNLAEPVDPDRHILPCCGSREGLFFSIVYAVRRRGGVSVPAVLFPDPSYPVYAAAAILAGAEAVPLPATAASGDLPDLGWLATQTALLARTTALIIGSPANPQGAVTDRDYLGRAATLARAHDFILICDECYSEVFTRHRPPSALDCAGGFDNILIFNSLSKRSGLPGLRSGFCAGDPALIEGLGTLRNLVAPQMPGPLQHASALAWADESVVETARALHERRVDLADTILGFWPGYRAPEGGFFLWLDVTPWTDSAFARAAWTRAGIRILPGSFLSHGSPAARSSRFVRVALVHNLSVLAVALESMASLLATSPCEISA